MSAVRSGLFNVGAEALEEHDAVAQTGSEPRAVVLLTSSLAPPVSASSRTCGLIVLVRAALLRLIHRVKRSEPLANAAADREAPPLCAQGEAGTRTARSGARARRRHSRRPNH
ncbi:MAG TPA: hypothetical protein DHW63_11600 [Hyphomonadaceae bacterium]|nr:hypothetical protein [Hyphomonadaceae bacterium]